MKVGTRVAVRVYVQAAAAPPKTPTPPPAAGQIVSFPNPQLLDRIKIGNSPYEPFRVWACDPAKAGSCTKSNPSSDIRGQARVFCGRSLSAGTPGSRIGSDQSYYPLEAPDPGDYAWIDPPTRWVVASNGFVSFTARAAVFTVIRCLRR